MKEILAVIKSVDSDFTSNNDKFNSYLELGSSYFSGNEYDKALGIFEKAIEEEPKNSGGWIGKAITHLAMTEVANISSVNIKDYLEKAVSNSDDKKIGKYLRAITLYYGYQYSAAIKLYIEQTNQAIADKQKAQVEAVIGIATAVAGGAIANNSKSLTGNLIGSAMLAGGAGATMKKGYDSFSLDKLSKSLYGNALAQTILSVPTIQSCHRIYEVSTGDLKHNVNVILDSWKESVIYLFQKEKADFLELLKKLNDTEKLLDKEVRSSVQEKMDEIIYFMDMIGMDESNVFKKVESIKSVLSDFTQKFDDEKISAIRKKREKAQMGCGIAAFAILGVVYFLTNGFEENAPSWPIFILIGGGILVYRYFAKKQKKVNNESGLSIVHDSISTVQSEFLAITIEKKEIDLKLLGS